MLPGYGLLQGLILIRLLPWILEQPFAASYWAFTFGATALPLACLRMVERGDNGPLSVLAASLFAIANAVILGIGFGTIFLVLNGRLLTHCMELLNRRWRCLLDRVGYPNDSHRNTVTRNPHQTSCLLAKPVGLIGQLLPSGNTVIL